MSFDHTRSPDFADVAIMRPLPLAAKTISPSITGRAASPMPETDAPTEPPVTESVHFGEPLLRSRAVISPEGKDTTSILPATAGLTFDSSEAPSGRPREV